MMETCLLRCEGSKCGAEKVRSARFEVRDMRATFKELGFVVLGLLWAVQTSAQTPATADPNPGKMTLTGSFDTVSTYMFRGVQWR
jgi:hypothetical protein